MSAEGLRVHRGVAVITYGSPAFEAVAAQSLRPLSEAVMWAGQPVLLLERTSDGQRYVVAAEGLPDGVIDAAVTKFENAGPGDLDYGGPAVQPAMRTAGVDL